MEEELAEVVRVSKEIIRNAVLGLFGEKELEKVEEAFKCITVDIDYDPKMEEKCLAYCRRNEVYWTGRALQDRKGKIEAISITIHELAHAFSKLISKGKINSIIEEAIANLFAEICINYQLQNEENISYISHEEHEKLKVTGYIKRNSYVKQGDFLRSVLYPLKSKGKDLEAIKEYLFNSKNNFINICIDILGKRFYEILENMQDVTINTEVDDSDNYLTINVFEEMMYILCSSIDEKKVWKKEVDKFSDINNGELYSTYSTVFEQAYFFGEIKPYLEGKVITIDDIKRLRMQIGRRTRALFVNNGVPNYMKKFSLLWYEQSLR